MKTLLEVLEIIKKHIKEEVLPYLKELEENFNCKISIREHSLPSPDNQNEPFDKYCLTDEWQYEVYVNDIYCFSYALQFDDEGEIDVYTLVGYDDESFLDYYEPHEIRESWGGAKESIFKRVQRMVELELPFLTKAEEKLLSFLKSSERWEISMHGSKLAIFHLEDGAALAVDNEGQIFFQQSHYHDWKKIN